MFYRSVNWFVGHALSVFLVWLPASVVATFFPVAFYVLGIDLTIELWLAVGVFVVFLTNEIYDRVSDALRAKIDRAWPKGASLPPKERKISFLPGLVTMVSQIFHHSREGRLFVVVVISTWAVSWFLTPIPAPLLIVMPIIGVVHLYLHFASYRSAWINKP